MIIPAIKTVFIDVPKAGSSSMTNFLINAFYHLPRHSNVNPSWNVDLCPAQSMLRQQNNGSLEFVGCRHEPLISIYKAVPDFHDYFLFAMVRNPFDRFKSFVYETLLFKKFNYPQVHFISRNPNNSLYTDSWYVNDRYDEKNQLSLFVDHLNIIKSKGWSQINVCSMPLHIWPQVYFLSLKTPRPYTLRILPVEGVNSWINDFKIELSHWSGIDINKNQFPKIDPIPLTIFIGKSNSETFKTVPYTHEWERQIHIPSGLNPDPEFQLKYPTYDLFLQDYKFEKSRIDDEYGSWFKEYRSLIEEVYEEDMITFGYV
jgi:hypothetical protein